MNVQAVLRVKLLRLACTRRGCWGRAAWRPWRRCMRLSCPAAPRGCVRPARWRWGARTPPRRA